MAPDEFSAQAIAYARQMVRNPKNLPILNNLVNELSGILELWSLEHALRDEQRELETLDERNARTPTAAKC